MLRPFPTLLLALLFYTACYAQPESRPSLVPWHEKYNIERVVLSANGQYMATLGDDRQLIISDLRKRVPVAAFTGIEPGFLQADTGASILYTLLPGKDQLIIQKRNFENGEILSTTSFPRELSNHDLEIPTYNYLPLIDIDFETGNMALIYTGRDIYSKQQLVVFSEKGQLVKAIEDLPAEQVNAIRRTGNRYWVLTAEGLYGEKNGKLEKLFSAEEGDRFANMQVKGDTLVLLSRYLQWIDTKTMTVSMKTDVASFLAHSEQDILIASVILRAHPFIVDEDGAAWLVNTRKSDLAKGRSAKPYDVARIYKGKLSYPLKGPVSDMGGMHREVAPAFAYNQRSGLFAFLNTRYDSEAEIALKDKGYLFSMGRRHIPVKGIYFLSDTAKVLVRLESYFEDGVIIDLSNGKMEAVDIREDYHVNTERFTGSKDYRRAESGNKIYSAALNEFTDYGTWRKGADLRLNVPRKDSCKVRLEGGTIVQLNEKDELVWTNAQGKNVYQISFKDDENNTISGNWFFDRFMFDKSSGLLSIYWKPKTTFNREIIHVIDLNSKKIVRQFQERGFLVLPGGREYVTGNGIYSLKDDVQVTGFPNEIQYASRFVTDPSGRYITCIIEKYDTEDDIMTWDRKEKKLAKLGSHQQVKSIQQHPFSSMLFTIGLDGKICVWNPAKQGLVSKILFNANRGEYKSPSDLQPSYLFLLPDGNYMGENKYYNMITWRDQNGEYPLQQMDARFHRPDKVLAAFGYAGNSVIKSLQRMADRRLSKARTARLQADIRFDRNNIIPFDAGREAVILPLKNSGSPDTDARVTAYVNGTALWTKPWKDLTKRNEIRISVPLVDASNHIRICMVDGEGMETAGDYVYINATPQEKKELYFVGLGLSSYKDPQNNLKYAAKDMQDIHDYLATTKSFENIHSFIAKNERVNKKVLDSISHFLSEAKPGDQVICYFAGHGMLDTASGNYFLSTYDWQTERPLQTGINIDALNAVVASSPARKKIMLIDACNSGLPEEEYAGWNEEDTLTAVKARGFKKNKGQQAAAVQFAFNHFNQGNGVDIMAASGGNEFAYETDSLKNGLFTYSLLTALKSGDADADHDNGVTVSELQRYVGTLVKTLSRGRQQPSFRQANLYQDVAFVASDDSYFSTMLLAAKQDHVPTLRICIEKENVPVDKTDPSGFTAFHYACREGSLNAVKYLVDQRADIRLKTNFHFSGLYLAAINRHEDVVYYLMNVGLDPSQELLKWQMDTIRKRGTAAIISMISNWDQVKLKEEMHYKLMSFLAAGNTNAADSLAKAIRLDFDYWHIGEGLSPLFVSIFQKQQGSIAWLINHGANVNIAASAFNDVTPLMAAVFTGNLPAVELLLKHGANKEAKDKSGKKAIDIAREKGFSGIVQLLMNN